MYCKDCGMDIGNGNYCGNCGSGLFGMVPNNGQFMTGRRKVNKLAFGMLALFTGSMGLHRFYSGKNRSGIMYLLFFWTLVPSFLGFIEGIIALTKEDDGSCNIEVDPDKFFI
ncbi:MAG: TM2 domain-containing protein [Candidatus Methanomethylophilaceae archaeon]|nr:TM2 domain-containing protein [Candidatus Methanomethylophilaceae archaeon]